ncbi:MAG TPA: YlcI/YnfO family protein [Rubrivivax sp.]|nr:YlcI/YnfO family protein [Rubrivivax sp.]
MPRLKTCRLSREKTAIFTSLHVEPELREAAEAVLQEGETLSPLIEAAVRETVERLVAYLLQRSTTVEELDVAERAIDTIEAAIRSLGVWPFVHRKAGRSPLLRELLIPFGHGGCAALFEIGDAASVTVLALRHQREDDDH